MQFLALKRCLFLTLTILLNFPAVIQSARICVFSVVGFMNYRSGYDPLIESLVDKGHEVTVFSSLPLHVDKQYERKIRYISPKAVTAHLHAFFNNVSPLEYRQKGEQHVLWDMLPILTLDLCHIILQDETTQQWLKADKRYDLFIVDSFWNECGIALSHAFQAKLILFSFHSNLMSWNLDSFGAVNEVSWIPDVQYEATFPMSYFQRLHFTIRTFRWFVYRNSFTLYQVRKFCRKLLKEEDFPSVREVEQNASLVLVNSHFSEEYARSLPPVFIPVGGVHIRPEGSTGFKRNQQSDVVKKIDNFLSNSSEFILVNIGCSKDTVINLPRESLNAILSAMQKLSGILKFVIIWDVGRANLKGSLPFASLNNVLVVEECSVELNTLLAHSQIKALISQGDSLDVQEAIYHAVPLILLPVVFEQDANAERIERLGRGIQLEITSLKEDHLVEALHSIIYNTTYKTNVNTASLAFRDRQNKPLDTALWWIEYTLRSETSLLKPLGIHQNWFSRRSLDVWLLIFFCIFSVIFVLIVALSVSLFKSFTCRILLICCNYLSCNNEISVKWNTSIIDTNVEKSKRSTKLGKKID